MRNLNNAFEDNFLEKNDIFLKNWSKKFKEINTNLSNSSSKKVKWILWVIKK